MTGVTAVLAEDEPLLRAELREALRALWPELRICEEVSDGPAALVALETHSPAVLFLDVEMPALDGMEISRRAAGRAHVVFVTAYSEYAAAAFEHGAVDYVLKPLSIQRLAKTVNRLKERLRIGAVDRAVTPDAVQPPASATPEPYLKWLMVPIGRELRLVTTDEICYLRADNKYAVVVTPTSEYLLTSSLKQLRQRLDPQNFWQIHRGYIVNASQVRAVHRSLRGTFHVQLHNRAERLPVSAAHSRMFKDLR